MNQLNRPTIAAHRTAAIAVCGVWLAAAPLDIIFMSDSSMISPVFPGKIIPNALQQ